MISWAPFGALWDLFGVLWASLGLLLGASGPPLGHLGALLSPLWATLGLQGLSHDLQIGLCRPLGGAMGSLRLPCAHLGGHLGFLHGVIFGDLGMVWALRSVIPLLLVPSQSQARRPSDRASVASE